MKIIRQHLRCIDVVFLNHFSSHRWNSKIKLYLYANKNFIFILINSNKTDLYCTQTSLLNISYSSYWLRCFGSTFRPEIQTGYRVYLGQVQAAIFACVMLLKIFNTKLHFLSKNQFRRDKIKISLMLEYQQWTFSFCLNA
jgi:hypothetical protein